MAEPSTFREVLPPVGQGDTDPAALEPIFKRFEEAWQCGAAPAIEDYLPVDAAGRQAAVVELAAIDLERRLNAGEAARVEDYLQRFPELAANSPQLFQLVAVEHEVRRRHDPDLALAEYLDRFPQLADTPSAVVEQPAAVPRSAAAQGALDPYATLPPETAEQAMAAEAANRPQTPARGSGPPRAKADTSAVAAVPGYQILGVLGRGGMGVVYKARQQGLNRIVALKMILAGAHAGPQALGRFRAEAEAIARLQHPNIIQIYEVDEHEGRPFFSLEFVPGGSLDKKLRHTPQDADESARLVETLARAMHAAHQQGIVHRDLKPGNILLQKAEGRKTPSESDSAASRESVVGIADCSPKITDFGLAKQLDRSSGHTNPGDIMGTPSYMAPEQATGKVQDVGPAADTYALGAILYEMLTGRPPFRGKTMLETLDQVRTQEPVPPTRLQPNVPRDLETICLKCLQKEPAKRYASAEGLADDLHRFLAREPIRARPVGLWERAVKWARRKPTAAALVGVSLIAALAFVGFTMLYALYQSQQADFYQQQLVKAHEQDRVRERINKTLLLAQQYEAGKNWPAANTELQKAREALDATPDLPAADVRADVENRLRAVQERLREQDQLQAARKKLQGFHKSYGDALFYQTMSSDLGRADSATNTRTAAQTALHIYGLDGASASADDPFTVLEDDRRLQPAADRTWLAGACYELLLIWAENEAAPPGLADGPEQRRTRAEKALALLTRAGKLGQVCGLQTTRTYRLREAAYMAQSKGEKFDLKAAEKADPQQPTGRLDWFLTALEHYRQERFIESIAACEEVLKQQHNDFWARYVKALGVLRQGDLADARAELTICLQQQDVVWPHLLRGYATSEMAAKRLETIRNLPLLHPLALSTRPLANRELDAAEEDFDAALKQDPDALVQYVGLVNRGVLKVRRQHWADAVADLRQAITVKPEGFQAHVNLAQALRGMGKWDEAVAALDQAFPMAPEPAELYRSRARLHLARPDGSKATNRAKARDDFERAIAVEPKGSKSDRLVNNLLDLGQLLHREHNYAAALQRYDRALKLKPQFVLIQRFRFETLLALQRPEEAGKALDSYLAVSKSASADVYQARGLVYAQTGKLSAAIEMYTLALQQDPNDAATRCHRGRAYLLSGGVNLALADFETCLREDTTNADARIGRANAHIRLRKLDEALEDAREGEKQAAEQGVLREDQLYNLACVYALVVGHLEAEGRTGTPGTNRRAAQSVALYKDMALDYLGRAVEKLPEERRAGFFRNQIEVDPALTAIRNARAYYQLAARFPGKDS